MISPSIEFCQALESQVILNLCQKASKVVIVTDSNVGPIYADKLAQHLKTSHVITIPAGEASKSRETKAQIENQLFSLGCSRDTLLIALGGGVITDLTGFVAATYCRGIPVIYLPSSLLAMVDAAIGGKTGINTPHGKNMLGTFTQPAATVIDTQFLKTLPKNEYHQAFSEIIKHALIADAEYFEFIESNLEALLQQDEKLLTAVIKRSVAIKSAIVSKDVTEQNKREILNFGHNIAHALERCSNYQIPHGQAVGIGLIAESQLSHHLGLLPEADFKRIQRVVASTGIDLTITFSKIDILNALSADKKNRNGELRFVVLQTIGAARIRAIDKKQVNRTISLLKKTI